MLSYAAARETDKRALAREALDRYRELNLIYDLADSIARPPTSRPWPRSPSTRRAGCPVAASASLLLESPTPGQLTPHPIGEVGALFPEQPTTEGLLGAVFVGDPEIVNEVAADPRLVPRNADRVAHRRPAQGRGRPAGVIWHSVEGAAEFQAGDLKILTAIAALTAPAVSQAQRYESVVRGDE